MPHGAKSHLRRMLLASGAVAILLAALAVEGPERAWAAQLHVHGPFSEGAGSIESQSLDHQGVVDVLWWSDHDFRIASYRCASTFSFEAWREAMDAREDWTIRSHREELEGKRLVLVNQRGVRDAEAAFSREAYEGDFSLRVKGTGRREAFAEHLWRLETRRNHQRRPLAAGVTLQLAVLPEEIGEDARIVIDVELSEHTVEGRLEPLSIRYTSGAEERIVRAGSRLEVTLPVRAGEWQVLELPVSRHAAEGFPEVAAGDNALRDLVLGVEARGGSTASALFDDLRILQERRGAEMFGVQRALIAELGGRYPDLVQHQGSEISYLPTHLNEFSLEARLPDYDELFDLFSATDVDGDETEALVTARIVEDVHARGGLVSYNHPFGAGLSGTGSQDSREELLEELAGVRVHGADLLEVGYRDRGGHPLGDYLWVWDRLAEQGSFLVGIGVTDAHAASQGRSRTNNMITWIYARSASKADLIEGLRAGRAYFGDPERFSGTVDLSMPQGFRMGSIVFSADERVEVEVELEGLEPGHVVRVIGPFEAPQRFVADGASFRRTIPVTLPATTSLVRVEVRTESGEAVVLSNPITFLRDARLAEGLEGSARLHEAR